VEARPSDTPSCGKDVGRLEGYTWHGNRHTFASRLVIAGVDLRTVQELGGWRTLSMVQRYAHLAPEGLAAAVERIIPLVDKHSAPQPAYGQQLRQNFDSVESSPAVGAVGVS
jgi:Phage integrase family